MFDSSWQTLSLNPLAALGILLLLGILGGKIATRSIRLPRVTGYIMTGLIIGPAGLKLISAELVAQADFFIQLGLGLALFEQGRRLDLPWLIRERALLLSTALISALTFACLFLLLLLFNLPLIIALTVASLLLATSPALVLDVIDESKAEGQVTERLAVHTGISTLIALFTFSCTLTYTHTTDTTTTSALMPFWLMIGSVATGLIAGLMTTRLNIWLGGRNPHIQCVLLCAMIALVTGLSTMLTMLPMLALLIFGITVRALGRQPVFNTPALAQYSLLFYVALFVALGTQLTPSAAVPVLPLILSIIAVRALVTLIGWSIAAHFNGLTWRRGIWLAWALLPLPAWPSALFALMAQAHPLDVAQPIQLVIGAVYLTQLLGPILTQQALRRAGECPPPPAAPF